MSAAAGRMSRPVAFDRRTGTANGAGGSLPDWQEMFQAFAEIIYQRGTEADQAGGLAVSARFKVRIHAHPQSRALTGEDTMRDLVTGARYNIREIDTLSDMAHVWLVAEGGVAT